MRAELRADGRVVPLDVLRGVAILLVLLAHTPVPVKESGSLAPVLGYLRYLGPSGVDLFFVLSGFLIGGLLFKELHDRGTLDLRRFLVRRGFKIWPAYAVFLGYLAVRLTLVDGQQREAGDVRARAQPAARAELHVVGS